MIERIYFETNSLQGRWPGNISGELHIIAALANAVGVTLCIPQSAVTEHEHSVVRRYKEHIAKAGKAIRDANRLLDGVAPLLHEPRLDEVAAARSYRTAVDAAVAAYGFIITPTTAKTIDDFVRFGAEHRPPFKNEDAGFRDAVHLHSIIEHLRGTPLGADGSAVLITADKRLGQSDVADVVTRSGVALNVHDGFAGVIQELTERLARPTRELLGRLGAAWQPTLLADAKARLLPRVVANLVGAPIGRGVTWEAIFTADFRWEPGATAIAPPVPRAPRVYPASFELRLDVDGIGLRSRDIPGGRKSDALDLRVTLLVSVDAEVATDALGAPTSIRYTSAYAFCVVWQPGTDVENLPENLQLLGEPI